MPLYHFSEEPDIRVFEPRPPLARPDVEPLVWAIDDRHQPMYFFPRDCPRACFWPGPQTSDDDRDRWLTAADVRMAIAVESRWLDSIRQTVLYRYTMPDEGFAPLDDIAGHWVNRSAVTPLSVDPVGDLLRALLDANVELRVMPSLIELWRRVIQSTLCFSGTRLRNAKGWDQLAAEL